MWHIYPYSSGLLHWRSHYKTQTMVKFIVFYRHCVGIVLNQLGWGLLSQFPLFRYFPNFSVMSKHLLAIEHHVYILQVLPQLSCGNTCQIWKWFKQSDTFARSEILLTESINERNFSDPFPISAYIITIYADILAPNRHRSSATTTLIRWWHMTHNITYVLRCSRTTNSWHFTDILHVFNLLSPLL